MKLIINGTKFTHLFFIMDSCNAYWQMLRMNHKCALDRLGNTISDHYHCKKKSNCQGTKFLQGEAQGKDNNCAVEYDEYDSIPIEEYFAPSLKPLAIYKQGIVRVDFRGHPEKDGAHAEQTWDHEAGVRAFRRWQESGGQEKFKRMLHTFDQLNRSSRNLRKNHGNH